MYDMYNYVRTITWCLAAGHKLKSVEALQRQTGKRVRLHAHLQQNVNQSLYNLASALVFVLCSEEHFIVSVPCIF